MSEKDFGQRNDTVRGVHGCKVDLRIGEGLVGWSKDGEGAVALQRAQEVGLDNGGHKGVVSARARRCAGNVPRRVGGREHLVDDVDDAVARGYVGCGDGCTVDGDVGSNAERQRMTVDGRCRHAVGDVGCGNRPGNDVVEQNVGEGFLSFRGVEGSEVNTGVGKGLIRRCEHGKGSWALEGFEQPSLHHARNQ